MINILDIQPNKVSSNLGQYSMVLMGDTGIGKTTAMMNLWKSINPDKDPLFLEFEDRYQNIGGIKAIKINTMAELKTVINQLKNPKAKELYSCIIIDTLDKFEEFCERYVLENRDAEILKDVGGYGEGSLRFKSALRYIGSIQSLGYTVHEIAQSAHTKDFETKQESDGLKLNKNTFSYCREAAYLVGYMFADKDERYVTFKKSNKYPDLKDVFNMPNKIKMSELKDVWEKAVAESAGDYYTDEVTIDKTKPVEDFASIKEQGMKYGNVLFENGHGDDAIAVLKRNLGTDNDGNVRMFDELRDTQIDLTKVIVMEFEELIQKYNLS